MIINIYLNYLFEWIVNIMLWFLRRCWNLSDIIVKFSEKLENLWFVYKYCELCINWKFSMGDKIFEEEGKKIIEVFEVLKLKLKCDILDDFKKWLEEKL